VCTAENYRKEIAKGIDPSERRWQLARFCNDFPFANRERYEARLTEKAGD
jgi:hypothetical protein